MTILDAVTLPRTWATCRFCGGELRARIVGNETLIICDTCERFTAAPAEHRQMVDDLIGAKVLSNRRN